jgi:hypothetical protein
MLDCILCHVKYHNKADGGFPASPNLLRIKRKEHKMELKIDPEFKKLIDPLEEDEFGRLEDSIAEYGCRDAIVTWQGYIIDGHNRYTICQHLDIEPPTVDYTAQLADRDAVKQWILENQLSRRNLHTFQKSEIVLKLEKIESQKAKERQLATLKQNQDSTVVQNSAPREESGKTRDIIAARAGVSHDTIDKVKAVLDSGIEPVITAARSNTVSTNAAYELTKAAQKDAALMAELQTTAPERVPEVRDRAKAAADAAMRDIERQEKESANEKQLESEPEPLASTFPKTANKFIAKMVLDDGVEQYPIHDDDDY